MMRPITLILAEAALETIPPSIRKHPSVKACARRKKRPIEQILLDKSIHHHAMSSLLDHKKRGRPDISHICLLLATSSPLYRENMLNIMVHTRNDQLIMVNSTLQWRPPKNYNRFCGLMEQLFLSENKQVPETGIPLLSLEEGTLRHILGGLGRPILLFTEKGEYGSLSKQIKYLIKDPDQPTLTLIVGAFPHGDFSPETLNIADQLLSISKQPLEAWTVVARGIYEIERSLLKCP